MTDEERIIISYVQKRGLDSKTRKREIIHRRFYIIAYLFYILKWNEYDIARLFNSDHSTVNYGKKKAYEYQETLNKYTKKLFNNNTKVLRAIIPCSFPNHKEFMIVRKNFRAGANVFIKKENMQKLQKMMDNWEIVNPGQLFNEYIESL